MTAVEGSYSFTPTSVKSIPTIVDCDPGIDDAVALALLAASPEFDLRAVTTVTGNVSVERSTRNALRALAAFGRPDVPVGAGAAQALVHPPAAFPPVHGVEGLGGVGLPRAARDSADESALEAYERVLGPAAPGEVIVIALAPLTNLALLLERRPDLADRIGLLATMSATIDRGNVTPFAEFNVWADPEAADRVLAEGDLPTVVFPLAATRRAALDEAQRLELASWSRAGATLAEMILGYDDQVTGEGWPLHDALVIAALLDPAVARLREATAIDVDTSAGDRRGETRVTWGGSGRRRLDIAVDADPRRFRALLRERISRLA